MRIMYVEDNAVNLELVRRIARLGGHEIVSYSNGKDALDALQTDTAHLILMDIQLEGEMDGIEVVKRLRARGDQRPVIAITAYAMRGDEERILGAGCNDYLPKPLPISQFITLVAKYDPSNVQPQAKPESDTRRPVTSQLVLPRTHPAVAATAATPPVPVAPVAAVPTPTPTAPVVPPAPPTPATMPVPATPVAPTVSVASTEPIIEAVAQVTPVPANTQPIVSAPKMEQSDDKPG